MQSPIDLLRKFKDAKLKNFEKHGLPTSTAEFLEFQLTGDHSLVINENQLSA